ncbi:hypothetical protein T492DRAFT_266995 [Pavlovales sp. CCMP2436]|nr:hypothetical protein T492DRAFT_266995 [Pavlovales sp. CCMP2436]
MIRTASPMASSGQKDADRQMGVTGLHHIASATQGWGELWGGGGGDMFAHLPPGFATVLTVGGQHVQFVPHPPRRAGMSHFQNGSLNVPRHVQRAIQKGWGENDCATTRDSRLIRIWTGPNPGWAESSVAFLEGLGGVASVLLLSPAPCNGRRSALRQREPCRNILIISKQL